MSEHIVRSYTRKVYVPEGIFGRKRKNVTVHVTRSVREDATLLAEREDLRAILERHGINIDKNIEEAIREPIYSLHHPDKNPYNKYETKINVAAHTEEDAAKYTTLLQITSIPLVARAKSYIKPATRLKEAMWQAVDRSGDPKIIVREPDVHDIEKTNERTIHTHVGYPLLPFKEFKEKALEKAAKNIYNELRNYLGKDVNPLVFIEFVKKAADAAEKIVEEKKKGQAEPDSNQLMGTWKTSLSS